MEVILKEDVKNLGNKGEVVKVKDGYARNYLIHRKLAFEATAANIRVIEEEKKKLTQKTEKEKRLAQVLANRISSASCTIMAKVGEDEKLFGSITNADIAQALEAEGLSIDKRQILLDETIKELGVFQVPVRVHPDITARLKLWVVKE